MEKLLELAKKNVDSAEVFSNTYEENEISFQNYSLNEIKNKIQTGYSLRIIKDGKIGTSYTKNLLDRNALVNNALKSLKGEIEADFSFPENYKVDLLDSFDSEIVSMSSKKILDNSKMISEFIKGKTSGQLNVYSGFGQSETRIINSNGLNVETRDSYHYDMPIIMYPRTYANIGHFSISKGFNQIGNSVLRNLIKMYDSGLKEVSPCSGNVQVVFTPRSLYALMSRLEVATNAKNIFQKVSPIKDKLGEKIFSEKLTIIDDPKNPLNVGARSFDDEGVFTDRLVLVENGVLKSFFSDLNYAEKLKMKPTGNGYKKMAWGGETVALASTPNLRCPSILPGDDTLESMIAGIKRGVLLFGALGAHSGNVINGDFSIGLNPGLYIENGEILGRVKDGMISGNIYDVMKRVSAVEKNSHFTSIGRYPHICFDDVKLSK